MSISRNVRQEDRIGRLFWTLFPKKQCFLKIVLRAIREFSRSENKRSSVYVPTKRIALDLNHYRRHRKVKGKVHSKWETLGELRRTMMKCRRTYTIF